MGTSVSPEKLRKWSEQARHLAQVHAVRLENCLLALGVDQRLTQDLKSNYETFAPLLEHASYDNNDGLLASYYADTEIRRIDGLLLMATLLDEIRQCGVPLELINDGVPFEPHVSAPRVKVSCAAIVRDEYGLILVDKTETPLFDRSMRIVEVDGERYWYVDVPGDAFELYSPVTSLTVTSAGVIANNGLKFLISAQFDWPADQELPDGYDWRSAPGVLKLINDYEHSELRQGRPTSKRLVDSGLGRYQSTRSEYMSVHLPRRGVASAQRANDFGFSLEPDGVDVYANTFGGPLAFG